MLTLKDIVRCGAELEIVQVRVHLNEPIPEGQSGFRQMVTLTYNQKEHNIIRDWIARNKITDVKYEDKGWGINAFSEQHIYETATFEIERLQMD